MAAQTVTLGQLAAEFQTHAVAIHARARVAMTQWCDQFLAEVRRNASGRPGPNIVTGEYVNSFYYDIQDQGIDISADVGSTSPQMNHLEYGFFGEDSRGRTRNDPPLPHWRPALSALGELGLEETMASTIDLDKNVL